LVIQNRPVADRHVVLIGRTDGTVLAFLVMVASARRAGVSVVPTADKDTMSGVLLTGAVAQLDAQ
jgi:hypothetical protein